MSPKPTRELPDLPEDVRAEANAWLARHRAEVPPSVATALDLSLQLAAKLLSSEESRRSIFRQLGIALGIRPSSERRKASGTPLAGLPKGGPKGQLPERERLASEHDNAQRLAKWHRDLGRRHGRKAKELKDRLMRVEDIELSAEEDAEIERENAEYMERLRTGERCDLDCAAPAEKLMTGAAVHLTTEEVDCEVDRDALPRGAEIKQEFSETRERISFSFTVTRLDIAVEKLSVATPEGTTLVCAGLEEIGPPKSKVTWEFLASMATLVAQYAMPLSRFAGLVSTPLKSFTPGEISRYFRYVAERLCPVYLELGKRLADSDVLAGDDTSSRVLEVTRALAELGADPKAPVPWLDYATADRAAAALGAGAKPTLALKIARELGFEFDRKDGKGSKTGFNTTVLSGREDAHDPRSTIVFFRSHFGGLGNLLTQVLARRRTDRPDVVIQSDLSTVNLISDESLRRRLRVTLAGCAAHARRSFAIYEDDEPDLCAWILHCFKGLAIYENGIDAFGRNRDNTASVRDADARALWEQIRDIARQIAAKWSRESPLGEAARYIEKHYDRLTYYLKDHRLTPNNNFSERMLRPEKLIENNSLFRQRLEGRFALDVVRSVLQTAVAARADLDRYLNWVLRMPPEIVASSPEEFTPLAFARLHSRLQ
jgi:hypothetical protein